MQTIASGSGRRYVRGKALGNMGFCTSWAVDTQGKGKEWLEVVNIDLPIKGLAKQFHNKRIVHISDLHCSQTVSEKYLGHCIDRVNELSADIVLMTGDYVTHDISGRFRKKVAHLVSNIESNIGTYACLGNHDYGMDGILSSSGDYSACKMTEEIENCGINVLRNQSVVLKTGNQSLHIVGLGDLWAHDFEPDKAFIDVEKNASVIVLAHNPESIRHLEKFDFDTVMCGHTHGVKFQFAPSFGWPIVNKHNYHSGMYEIKNKKLYVNRGLGRLGRFLFNARPEITVFNLC